jgi:hypothetical protein
VTRDAGKKREQSLFASWGGMPSVAIFRHRDPRIDGITKYRYHKTLGGLVEGAKAPSVANEEADPSAADRVYQAWSTYLRVNTRDTKKYSRLFQENVSYGYRRNLWGLRRLFCTGEWTQNYRPSAWPSLFAFDSVYAFGDWQGSGGIGAWRDSMSRGTHFRLSAPG